MPLPASSSDGQSAQPALARRDGDDAAADPLFRVIRSIQPVAGIPQRLAVSSWPGCAGSGLESMTGCLLRGFTTVGQGRAFWPGLWHLCSASTVRIHIGSLERVEEDPDRSSEQAGDTSVCGWRLLRTDNLAGQCEISSGKLGEPVDQKLPFFHWRSRLAPGWMPGSPWHRPWLRRPAACPLDAITEWNRGSPVCFIAALPAPRPHRWPEQISAT